MILNTSEIPKSAHWTMTIKVLIQQITKSCYHFRIFPDSKSTLLMEAILRKTISWAGRINEVVGRAVSWLTTLLVLIVCFDVATRYLLNDTAAWVMELEWHLFALIFLLGAGYTLRHDRHVRVDLFYAKFDHKDKALVNLTGTAIFLIPWCLLIIWTGFPFAMDAYEIGEGSPDPGGLPARWLVKFAIVIGATLLLIQAFGVIAASVLQLKGQLPPEDTTSSNSINEII